MSFGGHTPFYKLWYLMPMMSSVRAAGMAFFLVALPVCVWAAVGVEQLVRGELRQKALLTTLGVLGSVALLGITGLLQGFTMALVDPRNMEAALANAGELRTGSLRLLLVVLLGGGALIAVQRGALKGVAAAVLLIGVVGGDNWSIVHHFAKWHPPASVTYADDELSAMMKKTPLPFRNYDPTGAGGQGANVYESSMLMALQVPTLFGYFGMESKYFDELLGGKGVWTNQLNVNLWDLYAISYITLNQDIATIPGYHKVLGPVSYLGRGSYLPTKSSGRWRARSTKAMAPAMCWARASSGNSPSSGRRPS